MYNIFKHENNKGGKMKIQEKLSFIQKNLKAPKNLRNNFGKYNYRSVEGILENVKKIMGECCITLSDELISIGDRFYVKATATLIYKDESYSTVAFARENKEKKGMDAAQITGSSSSYARKYALNGLFAIDDNKDIDSEDNTEKKELFEEKKLITEKKELFEEKKLISDSQIKRICNLQGDVGISDEDFKKRLNVKFGTPDLKCLTKDQAIELINILKIKK
jgi:hypothetical protein